MAGPTQPLPDRGTRLDSWKEIAAHLKRDRRTVQRWEASEGLPVHRHVHQSQATVFAYTEELDAWLAQRLDSPEFQPGPELVSEPDPPEAAAPPARRAFRWKWMVAGLAVVLVTVLVTLGGGYPGLRFQEHDWILLEAFENRTGEAALDGALRNLLARELSGSTFVSVAPQERVEDTLRLMKKPLDAKIDLSAAREVCLRDGGIRALVTGVTEKLGSTYLLSVTVIDPASNVAVAVHTESAAGQDQIYPAARKLSNWVRESLGEAMDRIEESNQKLEKVTTPSLRALELFTQADAAARRQQWPLAVELTGGAIAEDPDFASAHLWRAYALKNVKREEWKTEADRALALADLVSERERYFIVAGNHMLYQRYDQAAPVLEALTRLYPDHYFGALNLVNCYQRLQRNEEARGAIRRVADLRPNDVVSNSRAAMLLFPFDVAAASRYRKRAMDVVALEPSIALAPWYQDFAMFGIDFLWAQDDVRGAHAVLERESKRPDARRIAFRLGLEYLRFGEFKLAEEWFGKVDSPAGEMAAATVAFNRGDTRKVLNILAPQDFGQRGASDLGFIYARLAPPGWEQKIGDAMNGPNVAITNAFQGQSALTQGRLDEALSRFKISLDAQIGTTTPISFVTGEMYATALEQAGKPEKAVEILEQVSRERITGPNLNWLRNQGRLVRLYRLLGRNAEAARTEARLRNLLMFADADHPILRELNDRK